MNKKLGQGSEKSSGAVKKKLGVRKKLPGVEKKLSPILRDRIKLIFFHSLSCIIV